MDGPWLSPFLLLFCGLYLVVCIASPLNPSTRFHPCFSFRPLIYCNALGRWFSLQIPTLNASLYDAMNVSSSPLTIPSAHWLCLVYSHTYSYGLIFSLILDIFWARLSSHPLPFVSSNSKDNNRLYQWIGWYILYTYYYTSISFIFEFARKCSTSFFVISVSVTVSTSVYSSHYASLRIRP